MKYFSHSIHFIIFALSLLSVVPFGDTSDLPPYVPTYDFNTDFYIVMFVILTFGATNFLGTLYIFYRTYLRWKYESRNIALSLRLPFYIAITDFLYSSATLINNGYSASNRAKFLRSEVITLPSPYCEVVGFFNTTSAFLNIFLVGAISVTTWLRVVREFYFDWGKYDYKIWSPIILISLIIPLISVRDFGAERCGAKYHGSIITIIASFLILFTLLTIVFCYAHVLKTIRGIKEDDSTISQFGSLQRLNIEKRTTKKVLTYILVFILQYIPILVFNVAGALQVRHVLIYTITAAISIGGIGNTTQYLFNEGVVICPSTTTSSGENLVDNNQQSSDSYDLNVVTFSSE